MSYYLDHSDVNHTRRRGYYPPETFSVSVRGNSATDGTNRSRLKYPAYSSSVSTIVRTEVVSYLDASYDISTYTPLKGYITSYYDLNTYTPIEGRLSAFYDILAFKKVSGAVNNYYDILTYSIVKGSLNASYALNTFAETQGYLNNQYKLQAFTSQIGYVVNYYDLNAYTTKSSFVNGYYYLNAYAVKTGYLNAEYDFNAFTNTIGYINSKYALRAFTSAIGYLNSSYKLDAFSSITGYINNYYALNTYTGYTGYVSSYYDLLANEIFYGYCINLDTGAVTKYENFNFNSLSPRFGAQSDGLYTLGGTTDNLASIDGFYKTGKMDQQKPKLKRAPDFYINMDASGATKLTVTTDSGTTSYSVPATDGIENEKTDLAKGHEGRYWQWKHENVNGSQATVNENEIILQEMSRRTNRR